MFRGMYCQWDRCGNKTLDWVAIFSFYGITTNTEVLQSFIWLLYYSVNSIGPNARQFCALSRRSSRVGLEKISYSWGDRAALPRRRMPAGLLKLTVPRCYTECSFLIFVSGSWPFQFLNTNSWYPRLFGTVLPKTRFSVFLYWWKQWARWLCDILQKKQIWIALLWK